MINIENIYKSFGDKQVLRNVSLRVGTGEVVCIIGPSGTGKSTFLRCINYLEHPDSGVVYVDGERIGVEQHGDNVWELSDKVLAKQRSKVGMVFQHFNLFNHLTCIDNIVMPMKINGWKIEDARDKAMQLLKRVGLKDHAYMFPDQLSGGQQQRVAIARAICLGPSAILFDEPTSALDPELVREVLDVMTELAEDGMTMIIVTHEISFASKVADRIVFMDGGSILEQGTPDEVLNHPDHERTKNFLEKISL